MNPVLLIPLCLGAAAVFQATLNQQIAGRWGLASAAMLNVSMAFACALVMWLYCVMNGIRGDMLRASFEPAAFRAWWVLPGVFGFGIVVGLPWAVAKVGALPTFVSLVAAQMVTSALWDRYVSGVPLNFSRVLGAVLAVASVFLAGRR